jgi:hypothetical protein
MPISENKFAEMALLNDAIFRGVPLKTYARVNCFHRWAFTRLASANQPTGQANPSFHLSPDSPFSPHRSRACLDAKNLAKWTL